MNKRILIFLLFLLSCNVWAGNPVSVPIHNQVYPFLDRMESLGIIGNILDGMKPLSRSDVAQLLVAINKRRNYLTAIDKQRLDNFLADFRFEIDWRNRYAQIPEHRNWYSPFSSFKQIKKDFIRFFQQNHPEEENYVFLWEDSTNSFYLNFNMDFTFDQRSDNLARSANRQTYRMRGTITENFAYALNVQLIAVRGDEGYKQDHPILKDTWNQSSGNKIYFDRSGGELAYRTSYVDFRFAHQSITWGLGKSGLLILSDYPEQYPYFSISKRWKWGSFTFLHAKLLEESAIDSVAGQAIYPDKWMAAHRFEFSPWNWMAFGITETVIYGNRSADWAYFIPFNFYRATEHNLGDRDNLLMALDLELRATSGLKFYGTMQFDEFKQSKLFTDWYGNKFAYLLGGHWLDPIGIQNLAFRLEYGAIRPWVYTHKYYVNRYINNTRSLGHWAGPNSQIIYAELEKDWHWRFITGLRYQQLKHGDNYPNENIGGDILLGHNVLLGDQKEPRETSKFLEGILATENVWEFYAQYEMFNGLFMNLSIARQQITQLEHTENLTIFHIGFRLDY